MTGRQNARFEYRSALAQKIEQYLRYSYDFSGKIRACFKAEDYAEFIGDIENFYVFYFPLYLNRFCEKYGITIYNEMDDIGKCYLEDKAFSTVLDLTRNMLLNNAEEFWQKKIADELYRKE